MIKTISFSLCFCFIFSFSALSQIGAPGSSASKNRNDNEEIMNQFLKGIKKNTDLSDQIAGSPYLEEEFQTARLIFPKNDPLEAPVRYNIAKEEMQVKIEANSYRALHRGIEVELNNTPFKMFSYKGEDKTIPLVGYFQILSPNYKEKELTLMKKYKKDVRRGKAAAAMQRATPPRYVTKDDWYLKFENSNPVLVERKTKDFLNLFPEAHRGEVKAFMKDHKLKSRSEDDLKAIVSYYNRTF